MKYSYIGTHAKSPAFRRLIILLQIAELSYGFYQCEDLVNESFKKNEANYLINRKAIWEDGELLRKRILRCYKIITQAKKELEW